MTLDSITKELMKAWKTSTGWAITLLSAAILGLSIVPGVSLSGLATFGIFFVALQALEFTKEQSKEWRRKDALAHCYEAERLYRKIKPIINDIIQAALSNQTKAVGLFSSHPIESYNFENTETLNRLLTEVRMIETHLSEMKKDSIGELLNLLIHLDCIITLIDIHSHDREGEEINHADMALRDVREAVEGMGITGRMTANLRLDLYVYEIKYDVLEK